MNDKGIFTHRIRRARAPLSVLLGLALIGLAGNAHAFSPGDDDDGGNGGDPTPPDNSARDPGTGPWQLVSDVAGECNLDPDLLQQADSDIGTDYVVVRYGKLCHENVGGAFGGSDSASQVYSTTKTMGALTIGALIHQTRNIPESDQFQRGPLKQFDRVDQWLRNFSYHEDATIAHVLAMTAAASNSLDYGDKQFRYDTVGNQAINSLSDVVNNVVEQDPNRLGSNIGQFWRQHLAEPLGLRDSSWGNSDQSKNFATSWTTTLRDMARVGLLMNNGGEWNGERLVDLDFLYNQTHPAFEDANTGYGYLTWLNEDDDCAPKPIHESYPHGISEAPSCMRAEGCDQTHDVGVFYAAGLGGQYIIVHRGLDMVIAVKESGGQSGMEPVRFWEALRPAVLAHDPNYQSESAFCQAYGSGDYAPDLEPWEDGR